MRTYATLDALKTRLGLPSSTTAVDERAALALVTATAWVDHYLGTEVTPDDVWSVPDDPDDWDDELEVDDTATAAMVGATLVVAVRFYKSADVPFGIASGLGDLAMYVSRSIPEAETMLLGHRELWGIA